MDEGSREVEGGEWMVTELDGEALVERSSISLEFGEGQVTGLASCNRYAAEWSRRAAADIQIGPAQSTLRACAPAIMDQERRFLELLGQFTSVRVTDGGELVLETPQGQTLHARRP